MNAPAPNLSNRDNDRFDNEVGLLGALLIYGEPTLYRAAAAICTADHFHDRFNARLFETIGRGVDGGLHAFRLTHWIIGELKGDAALRDLNMSASAMVARYCALAFPAIAVEGAARQVRHDHLSVELSVAVEDGATGAAEEIAAEMERLSRAHLQTDTGLQPIGAAAPRHGQNHNRAQLAAAHRPPGSWRVLRLPRNGASGARGNRAVRHQL